LLTAALVLLVIAEAISTKPTETSEIAAATIGLWRRVRAVLEGLWAVIVLLIGV